MEVNSFPHSITFNGKNSLEFSLYVSGDKTFNSPEKDYTKVSVPGRSGDLVISNNRYKNVNVVYAGIIIDDYSNNVEKIRDWLLSPNGYCRLEDTYHPDEFRLAYFSGPIDFDTLLLEAGSVSLTFDCKPQRFLKSAENIHDYTYVTDYDLQDEVLINNPTSQISKPLIQITINSLKFKSNTYYKQLKYMDASEQKIGAPSFSTSETYDVGDYVEYSNNYYKCKIAIETAGSWDETKWDNLGSQPYDILTEKPSDWYNDFKNYYILSGSTYKNISKDSTYDYSLSVGTGLITLKDVKIGESYFIDCENLECYDGYFSGQSVNIINLPFLKYHVYADAFSYKNEKLIVVKWPTLVSGNNTIKESETNNVCCTIQINPRWWRL